MEIRNEMPNDLKILLAPPKDGDVVIFNNGVVVMSKNTYDEYEDIAETAAIRAGRTGEE